MALLLSRGFRPLLACSNPIMCSAYPVSASRSYFMNSRTEPTPSSKILRSERLANSSVSSQSTARYQQFLHTSMRSLDADKPKVSIPKVPLSKRLRALTPIPHENIWTIPNILTFSRLIAAPVVGYLILHDQTFWAFSLFVYAGVTDLIDGWIARQFNQGTVVGTVIDPMADKTLMTIVTVTLAVTGSMPIYLAVLILGRDVLLAISAIYYRYISLPPPKTFTRYWDFSLPSAEVHPTGISKINTALQLGLIGATMGMPLIQLGPWAQTALTGFQYTVAVTTVWSGASYIYSKDVVKILNQEEKKGRDDEQELDTKTENGKK